MGITVERRSRNAEMRLSRMADRAEDLTPAWPRVGRYLSGVVREQFATRGARLGTPWRPLSDTYAARKARMGWNRRTLVRTGALRSSFTSRPMAVERYGRQEAHFGSDLQTAVWHQRGTHRNGKRVNPPRPMIRVTPEVRSEVKQILAAYIVGKGRRSG
jgi:phage gpG-like protein